MAMAGTNNAYQALSVMVGSGTLCGVRGDSAGVSDRGQLLKVTFGESADTTRRPREKKREDR